ncbi:glycosyl transferases group 1 family protein [Janthinobacterium agaricidamnosum NBRC 102515 = DSM 9628]|uniref:Glycosyl transferases group 1 family protein n=2 Tax=Janthinobacterium agaricidamnosum TaxID=55508 RepID=W0VAI4_9BURK|nr:glycosyl transferases group 1 family protein [Janthinobacterium agaricidamnosum NBRC 102515 = DSM 9628]
MIKVMLLGPSVGAASGVSTHLNQIFQSTLAQDHVLLHFQVGSEGRAESLPHKLLRFFLSPLQFAAALWRHRPDIVHLNTSMVAKSYWRDLVYLLVAKSMRTKVLYQVHGGALPQDFFAGHALRTGLLRRVLRLADSVVLLAQQELHAYRAFEPALVLSVIPNSIALCADPVQKINRGDGPLQLLYLGRLVLEKGVAELVDALALVRAQGVMALLVIAGGGPDEQRLRQRVAELGLQDAVQFAGPVFGEAKQRLWEQADLFGFPTYREGLPYVLLESMAARTPALACPVGGIPDVMQDGVHGFFVPPRDPQALAALILRLDRDRPLLRSMAQAGRERVERHYTVERLAHDFRAIYAGLLK